MKKNLQEAEYKEIKGLDIRGQLLENAGAPEDRGDGKPFLMHKLRVMIGPYQKDIPITNQELRKIMFIQENKNMTLKEMIKQELISMLNEGVAGSAPELDRVPSDIALKKGKLDVELEELYDALRSGSSVDPKLIKQLIKTAQEARKRLGEENINEGDSADNGSQTSEKTLAKARAQGERHGKAERQGRKIKLHSYDEKDVQAAYLDGYKKGKAAKLPYAEGRRRRSVTDGMPVLQGTAKEIDDLIGAAIDAHMKADRFAKKGATDFATLMDRAVGVALADIEPLLSKMNRIAIEKTMPHLTAAKSSTGEERLMALGKAKDALVPR